MARLRRSDLDVPGIRRRRRGRSFSYSWDSGEAVGADELDRIRALAVPPAWNDVWICPWPNGHIQAVGTDAAGRRQYRYHDRWREQRDHEKFERILEFGRRVPALRSQVDEDIGGRGLERPRVLATAVRLLDIASLRIGGKEYAEDHETYGLTTLRKRHARVAGDRVVLTFTAKSSRKVRVEVTDEEVARTVGALKKRQGEGSNLFACRARSGWTDIGAIHVNDYIKDAIGSEFSAKDFRTWNATVLAASLFAERQARARVDARPSRRAASTVVASVAEHLGNTPAVCRASYIDPRVIECSTHGETIRLPTRLHRQDGSEREVVEKAVLRMLTRARSAGRASGRRPAA